MAIGVSLNGNNFERVIYSKEVDFERLVTKNAATIFGDKAIYIDAKKKLNTTSLGGTIPDGFLIDISDSDDPQFYLVEVELQSHDFFRHIFPQITKFFAFFRDSKQRTKLIETIFTFLQDSFTEDMNLAGKIMNIVKTNEVYKFLKDTIDGNQNILIVIDSQKPEFEEIIDTYTDTWGKMVKVLIVNHFRQNNSSIITVEPPFRELPFGDAISPFPGTKSEGDSKNYTEEYHLENCSNEVKEMCLKLKNEFLKADGSLTFKSVKSYIGVHNTIRKISNLYIAKKFIWVLVVLPQDEVDKLLESKHHKLKVYYPGETFVQIKDTEHWDEIQRVVEFLVKKYQEA